MTRLVFRISVMAVVVALVTGLGLWFALDWARGNKLFTLHGQVVDRQTGRPIAGASAKFELFRKTDLGVPFLRGQSSKMESVYATSDASGRFVLRGLHGRWIRLVKVEAQGYQPSPTVPYVVQGIIFDVTGMPDPKPPSDPKSPVKILMDPLPARSP